MYPKVIGTAFAQSRQAFQQIAELEDQQMHRGTDADHVARLLDILGRRTPMDPPAIGLADGARQSGNHLHQEGTGDRDAGRDPIRV